MRKNMISILVLAFTLIAPLMSSAAYHSTVTECSYLDGDKLCRHDGRRTECGPIPEQYTLATSIEEVIDDMTCVEKSSIIVTRNGITKKTGRACGPVNNVEFVRKNLHLYCAPINNEESGMRIGN